MSIGSEPAQILEASISSGLIAGAAAEVGTSRAVLASWTAGRISGRPDAAIIQPSTRFDLASLTKVIATTALALEHVAAGTLALEDCLTFRLASWAAHRREPITIRQLLEHCSGLPAHRPYFERLAGRAAYEEAIASEPLESAPGTHAVYSDLGFILLGFVLEDIADQPLGEQFATWQARNLNPPTSLAFAPIAPDDVACSEYDQSRARLLCGEVHDGNAAALGGTPGHAGLFGTGADVGSVARWWLSQLADSPKSARAHLARAFARPSSVPNSSRALGWDTMRPSSSCGTRFSAAAIGHTGFTGTSMWVDPMLDLYVVLLTNRLVPFTRSEDMQHLRRNFHDAVLQHVLSEGEPTRQA